MTSDTMLPPKLKVLNLEMMAAIDAALPAGSHPPDPTASAVRDVVVAFNEAHAVQFEEAYQEAVDLGFVTWPNRIDLPLFPLR